MKKVSEIIETIDKQVDSYYSLVRDGSVSIESLSRLQAGLAVNSYYLAQILAEMKADYNNKYFIRKIEINNSKQGMMNDMSMVKAEVQANYDNAEKIHEELKSQSATYKCEVLLKQINMILSSLTQYISNLKREQDLSRNQQL